MDPLVLSIVLLLVGLTIVVLEFFVPSGGALSILAAFSIIAAVVLAFFKGIVAGTIMLSVAALLVPVIFALAVKFWPHTPLGRMILNRPERDDSAEATDDPRAVRRKLVGRTGKAKTKMLPSGIVTIDGRDYDATTEGMSVDPGQIIQVAAIRDNRVVVRPVEHLLPRPADPNDVLSQPADAVGIEPLDDPLG